MDIAKTQNRFFKEETKKFVNEWMMIKNDEILKCWQSNYKNWMAYLIEMRFKGATLDDVLPYLLEIKKYQVWRPVDEIQSLEKWGKDLEVQREVFLHKPGTKTQNTHFCICEHRIEHDWDTVEILNFSTEHEAMPNPEGFIKGYVYFRNFYLEERGNEVMMIYCGSTWPGN